MSDEDRTPTPALEQARAALAEAQAKRVETEPVLVEADNIIERLRLMRTENHWAPRVRKTFRATRGAA